MIFTSIPEYLTAVFAPLKYVLLAYALNGVDRPEKIMPLAAMLGLNKLPGSGREAWELYGREEKKTAGKVNKAKAAGALLPYEHVCGVFDLNRFERFALALALAVETDPVYSAAVSAMENRFTPSLLLRLYSTDADECIGWQKECLHRSASWRLIFETGKLNDPISLRPMVKRFLLGVEIMPEGVSLITPDTPLPDSLLECGVAEIMARQLAIRPEGNIFVLTGSMGAGKKYQLKRFAKDNGLLLLVVNYEEVRNDKDWLDELAVILALTGGLLCLSEIPVEDAPQKSLLTLIRSIRPPLLFVTCAEEINVVPDGYSAVYMTILAPDVQKRLDLWRAYGEISGLRCRLEDFAAQYRFTIGQIENSCQLARELAAQRGAERVTDALLHEACRRQFSHGLGSLAIPVDARFTWDDIVLLPLQRRLLRHICAQVKYRDNVYESWGFETKVTYGRGVRALFTGPPGTGKTMAAQVIASELHMELYKVHLSSLVSKYIGETEKNLDEVFNQAAKSGGILFFDEADAIFGKRGEQKDSHDKYANLQTAFLLQRFEEYDGVVLLATNLISNLDPAFTRRIQNRVDFPLPAAQYRRRIWEGLLIKSAPFEEDLDIVFLAEQFELTGSAIRNIVLQAAFLAAATERNIGMGELLEALVMEYAKTDKLLSKHDLGEYGYLLDG